MPEEGLTFFWILGASNALLVIILTALFCTFWSLFISVVLQHPQTEEQYLKYGSTMPLYKFFNCPSSRLYPRAFSKLNAYQSEVQDFCFLYILNICITYFQV